ncbi:MAG: DUF616 domain-containing protein [Bacilli bacterium]|nr:DUF616 domain-containing protein [Bacilli bacterium]
MNKICVYTCVTGNYDNVKEIETVEKGIDYYCFTNNKNIKLNTWKVIYINDPKLDNHTLSRKIKILGHEKINKKYDVYVWMDASVVFQKSISKFVKKYLKKNSFAAFKHCERNCIYEEIKMCYRFNKDTKENLLRHNEFLEKEKYPRNNGLYEMTVFIRKDDPIVDKTMNMWFDMVKNHIKRDQLSFMYCVWKTGMKIDPIEENVWANDWFYCQKHMLNKKLENYRIYFGDIGNEYDWDKDIKGQYSIKNKLYSFNLKSPCSCEEYVITIASFPGINFDNLKIKGVNDKDIEIFNYVELSKENFFYNSTPIIKVNKKLKKGERVGFSIEMSILSEEELYDLLSNVSEECIRSRMRNTELEKEIKDKQEYINKLYEVVNSSIFTRLKMHKKRKDKEID